MKQGKVFYKEHLAGIITETLEGDYIFKYDKDYIKNHFQDFLTFTMPVRA